MFKAASILVLSAFVLGAGSASAKTPDGKTPAQETVCDNETGAAYGLCNAYCEAKDCGDPNQTSSDRSCEVIKDKFERMTGRPMPCSLTCPCPGLLKLFNDISIGKVPVSECIAYERLLYVATPVGDYVVVDDGPLPFCDVNGQPPFIELTETERLVCRVSLRKAVESRGGTCRPPE
jgi:hypothetical protein